MGEVNIRILVSDETYQLITKMQRSGESNDETINRGFSYLDGDSEFWNQE